MRILSVLSYFPILLSLLLPIHSLAQATPEKANLRVPMDIPLRLSGNFGELRRNHFHSGLDFKTQGRTGIPVYSAADGYVSRVLVSPWGFGRAVYITHPELGLTTVYGHLDSFAPFIDNPVRGHQYSNETFRVDLTFKADEIPVKRGQKIGLSGNAGSSGGPHLHMDVRDTDSGDALDPLAYYAGKITDTSAPEVRALALYTQPGEGAVGTGTQRYVRHVTPAERRKPFTAWGKVISAIKAYDRMTGTTNIYGVKHLELTVDGKPVYSRHIDRFDFDESRAVNTLVDYATVINSGEWYMWTRRPQSLPLAEMVTTDLADGIIDINEERDFACEWILTDHHGNISRAPFTIRGQRMAPLADRSRGDRLNHTGRNRIDSEGVKIDFPAGTFYDDTRITVASRHTAGYLSPVVTVGNSEIPIKGEFSIAIALDNDTLDDPRQYCMVRIDGKRRTRVDAEYTDGHMRGTPSALGSFAVTVDTVAPRILPQNQTRWSQSGVINLKISDNLSGINTYRGTIDGKFALFELDGKTGRLWFKMDPSRFTRGQRHDLQIEVSDICGNKSTYNHTFVW